jgi:hypothetical protein
MADAVQAHVVNPPSGKGALHELCHGFFSRDVKNSKSRIATISKAVRKRSDRRTVADGKILEPSVAVEADGSSTDSAHGKRDLGELIFVISEGGFHVVLK